MTTQGQWRSCGDAGSGGFRINFGGNGEILEDGNGNKYYVFMKNTEFILD
jgi:hypothetical protein